MPSETDPLHKSPDFRKVVYFNGPPRSGKSYGAETMRSFVQINAPYLQPRVINMSEPLKKGAHALYDAFHSWDYYDSREGAPQKDMICGDFLGQTPRQAYINLSDHLIATHGEEAFGWIMRKRLVRYNGTQFFAIDSCGMIPELRPVIDLVGQRNVMILEIHAQGLDFDNDSRAYIGDQVNNLYPHVQVKKLQTVIGSQEDKEFYKMMCQGLAKNFLKIEERE